MDKKEAGVSLRTLREKQRLSLRATGDQAHVSKTYLWRIENGNNTPSPAILRRLAPVYQVTTQELFKAWGYLEEQTFTVPAVDRLKMAVNLIISNPSYKFETMLDINKLTPEVMRFIIELYEKTTGKKLL